MNSIFFGGKYLNMMHINHNMFHCDILRVIFAHCNYGSAYKQIAGTCKLWRALAIEMYPRADIEFCNHLLTILKLIPENSNISWIILPNKYDWNALSSNKSITAAHKERYPFLFSYIWCSNYRNKFPKYARKNIDPTNLRCAIKEKYRHEFIADINLSIISTPYKWNFWTLSYIMPFEFIRNHLNLPWEFNRVSLNNSITWKDVVYNQDLSWNYQILSFNTFDKNNAYFYHIIIPTNYTHEL